MTHDGLVILGSEAGVLPVKPEEVKFKGRLQPGRMLLVDTVEGRIIPDEELKERLCQPQALRRVAEGRIRSRSTVCLSRRACMSPISEAS